MLRRAPVEIPPVPVDASGEPGVQRDVGRPAGGELQGARVTSETERWIPGDDFAEAELEARVDQVSQGESDLADWTVVAGRQDEGAGAGFVEGCRPQRPRRVGGMQEIAWLA